MGEQIRLGVVGVGDFGMRHALVASALPEIRVIAVADADFERAKTAAARVGGAACREMDEMLSRHDVDAVVVATPQPCHLTDVASAVAAGVHVMVEKPVVGA